MAHRIRQIRGENMVLFKKLLKFNSMGKIVMGLFLSIITIDLLAQNNRGQVQIPEISIDRNEKMIDVGGRELHCCIYGKDSPTVVLLSGFNAPQIYWNSVIPDLAERATVVTYDRPGYGKSQIGELPLHGEQTAKDLHILLEKLDIPKPYIIVGHSYGGSIARLYVSMYPEDIGGLVLEDSQHEEILDEQRKLLEGEDLKVLEDMVKRMSAPVNAKTDLEYQETTRVQLKESDPLPVVPYVVITAGERMQTIPPIFSEKGRKDLLILGKELQKRLLTLIPGGK